MSPPHVEQRHSPSLLLSAGKTSSPHAGHTGAKTGTAAPHRTQAKVSCDVLAGRLIISSF
jgi:hypothetical protein